MSEHKKLIEHLLLLETDALREKEKRIQQLPPGYLVQQESNKGYRLYWVEPVCAGGATKERYHRLKDEDYEIACALREKFLLRKQIPAHRNNITYYQKLLDHYIPCDDAAVSCQLDEPYRSLEGLQPPKAMHVPTQSENPFYPEHLKFRNSLGEYFRSKSEVLISEILYAMGIPYHYEKHLTIGGETKYPDFTILRGGPGKDKYIEYFGMMDKNDYFIRNKDKINWYLNHQIIPNDRILFLYENTTSGLDTLCVQKQIETFLSA